MQGLSMQANTTFSPSSSIMIFAWAYCDPSFPPGLYHATRLRNIFFSLFFVFARQAKVLIPRPQHIATISNLRLDLRDVKKRNVREGKNSFIPRLKERTEHHGTWLQSQANVLIPRLRNIATFLIVRLAL